MLFTKCHHQVLLVVALKVQRKADHHPEDDLHIDRGDQGAQGVPVVTPTMIEVTVPLVVAAPVVARVWKEHQEVAERREAVERTGAIDPTQELDTQAEAEHPNAGSPRYAQSQFLHGLTPQSFLVHQGILISNHTRNRPLLFSNHLRGDIHLMGLSCCHNQ